MLEFLVITILTIWLVGLLGRWLLQRWLQRKQREFAAQFGGGGQPGGRAQGRRNTRPEGDVSVQQTAPIHKKVNRGVGDYVEFEEVEIAEETIEEK